LISSTRPPTKSSATAAAYRGSRLLRALSDVQATRQDLLFSHQHLSELGKLVAGLDVAYPPYVM
jgi:hypothetical protein